MRKGSASRDVSAPRPASPRERKAAAGRISVGTSPHHDEAAATELGRNALARERYVFLQRMNYVLIGLIAAMMAAVVFLATRPVEPRYFTTDSQGRIREITALNKPMPSNDQVLNWVTTAVTRAYSLSFASYQRQLDELRHNFTSEGWKGFEEALRRTNFLENLIAGKYITSSVPSGAPVVAAEGLVNGVYGWRIQVPLIITYESAGARTSQTVMVDATVVRRPETENPAGLGIAQFISR